MSKLVLVLNCGSSSIRFAIIDPYIGTHYLTGMAECFYLDDARIKWQLQDGFENRSPLGENAGHDQALTFIVDHILDKNPQLAARIGAIGHRIVHGGEKFTTSVLVNEDVIKGIEECASLAPLHNYAHVMGIRAAIKAFPKLPNVTVFDTAFHQTMPEEAYLYAIPYKYYRENSIRRYGMHGSSHYYVSRRAAKMLGKPCSEINVISCHLGNGGSVCAIKGGKSVDTSMGLTPLEGLVMGTRSGDIDPAIIFHLHEVYGYDFKKINDILTKESGLLGLTEVSSDCRFVEENFGKDIRADRAMEVYCHRLAKYIASYTACLGDRLDAIIFTGGIGENSVIMRKYTLGRLALLGFKVDREKNFATVKGKEGIITTPDSPVAMVVTTNEGWVIAKETASLAKF